MLTRKKIPGAVWLVAGILVTLLLIPTAAVAAGMKITLIDGSSGNVADVTPAGQLKVSEASPDNDFQNTSSDVQSTGWTAVGLPLPRFALVITVLHIGSLNPALNYPSGIINFQVENSPTCVGTKVGNYFQSVPVQTAVESEISLAPGLPVPVGDALCAQAGAPGETADVSVSGYTVSASVVAPGA